MILVSLTLMSFSLPDAMASGGSSSQQSAISLAGSPIIKVSCPGPNTPCVGGPGDIEIAVGTQFVVETREGGYVYRKSDHSLYRYYNSSTSPTNIFGVPTSQTCDSDKRVLFDAQSGVWFATFYQPHPGGNCSTKVVSVAVNPSIDPTTAWKIYQISQISGTYPAPFPDHPEIAVSSDKLVITVNDMQDSAGSPAYWVLRKSDFVSETTPYYLVNGPAPQLSPGVNACNYYSQITPVKTTNPSSIMYLVCEGSSNSYLFSIDGTPPSPLLSPALVVTMPSFAQAAPNVVLPNCSPNCPQPLIGNYPLSQDAYLAHGILWYGVDDQCTPSTEYACFHLVEINMTISPTVVQSFDYGINQQSVYLPRIIVDAEGDLGLIFGYSSTTSNGYPSLALTGQISGDAPGTLIPPVQIAQGMSYESAVCRIISVCLRIPLTQLYCGQ